LLELDYFGRPHKYTGMQIPARGILARALLHLHWHVFPNMDWQLMINVLVAWLIHNRILSIYRHSCWKWII